MRRSSPPPGSWSPRAPRSSAPRIAARVAPASAWRPPRELKRCPSRRTRTRAPEQAPVWPVFGDLMACLFGLFVLFFVWAISFQVDLARGLGRRACHPRDGERAPEDAGARLRRPARRGADHARRRGASGSAAASCFELSSAELQTGGHRAAQRPGRAAQGVPRPPRRAHHGERVHGRPADYESRPVAMPTTGSSRRSARSR